jgi:uncharacterized membrane protein YebE (DUF533 family)
MSLMSTLAKVAIGVAVAKGASSMMNKSGRSSGSGDLGGLLGDLMGGASGRSGKPGAGGGSLEDMLGGLLGGAAGARQGGMPGGLGGLLEQLGAGAATGGSGKGGLEDVVTAQAGDSNTGGLLEGLAGALGGRPKQSNASFGTVLNSSFDQNPEPEIEPSAQQEVAAGLMLRAMIQAAKSDGKLDDAERQNLIGRLGEDVSQQEADFVQAELAKPVDVGGLVAQTPKGLEPQLYAMSVLAIDLDSRAEAEYLHKLATGYGMDAKSVNAIHAQLGVPSLYT